MRLIYCSIVGAQTFTPRIVPIVEEDDKFFEYGPLGLSRELIADMNYMNKEQVEDIVYSIIQKEVPNKIVSPEELLEKHPHLSSEILPYLRDKKLDELI
jgi:hypothetical protein